MTGNLTVLVVDDEPDNIDVLKMFLHSKGHSVLSALSGSEACTILGTHKIDVVLLDVMMGGMDGYEACTTLKSLSAPMDIPIIFISARANQEDRDKGKEVGGYAYITKPYSFRELDTVIKAATSHVE